MNKLSKKFRSDLQNIYLALVNCSQFSNLMTSSIAKLPHVAGNSQVIL